MAKSAIRGIAALIGVLALVGNLSAAELFLKCTGTEQNGAKHNALFKIDTAARTWDAWSDPARPYAGAGTHWKIRQCDYSKTEQGEYWHKEHKLCSFAQDRLQHEFSTENRFGASKVTETIDRVTAKWRIYVRNSTGPRTDSEQTIEGECSPTTDPTRAAPPKAKF